MTKTQDRELITLDEWDQFNLAVDALEAFADLLAENRDEQLEALHSLIAPHVKRLADIRDSSYDRMRKASDEEGSTENPN